MIEFIIFFCGISVGLSIAVLVIKILAARKDAV
jgi:hypothetical protein